MTSCCLSPISKSISIYSKVRGYRIEKIKNKKTLDTFKLLNYLLPKESSVLVRESLVLRLLLREQHWSNWPSLLLFLLARFFIGVKHFRVRMTVLPSVMKCIFYGAHHLVENTHQPLPSLSLSNNNNSTHVLVQVLYAGINPVDAKEVIGGM